MEARPLIFVLVCTIDEGIRRVGEILLAPEAGVRYVVSWQQTHVGLECPTDLHRPDVVVTRMEGKGLSRNRNHAISAALELLGDEQEDAVFIIADDDEQLEPGALAEVRRQYMEWPQADIVLWQTLTLEDGLPLKPYPATAMDYRCRPRSYYASSVEMTLRSRVFSSSGIRFDERFGLGSERLSAGEEAVFLRDAERLGLRIWLTPKVLCRTRRATTGQRALDVKSLRSKGAEYGYGHSLLWAFLRSAREAAGLAWRHGCRVAPVFYNIWYGVKYIRQCKSN